MFDAAQNAGIEPTDGAAAGELSEGTARRPLWSLPEPPRGAAGGPAAVTGRPDSPGLPAWAGGSSAAVLSAPLAGGGLEPGEPDEDRWGGLPRRAPGSERPPERSSPARETGRPSWAAASGPGAVMAAVPARTVVTGLHIPSPIFGPPGKHRLPAAVVALGLLTLGLYPLFWHHRVNREMGDFDPRMRVRPGRSTLAVAVPVIAGLVVAAAAAARILLDRTQVGPHLPLSTGVARWGLGGPLVAQYVLALLPWSLLAVGFTLERLRSVQDHVGVPTDRQLRPASLMGWLLLPLAGPVVLLVMAQRRLNELWELTG